MKYRFVCVTVTAIWAKIGRIFMFFTKIRVRWREHTVKIGSNRKFVYFSLKKSVGTTSISISTFCQSLFEEKMEFNGEKASDFHVFHKNQSGMEIAHSQNRLKS